MPITVRTFDHLGEAATALAGDRDARFLAGGTLVMRAINEGATSFSTVVRSSDRAFREIRAGGSRIELGAGVTMAKILAHRELAFLHPVARTIGGPALRSMASVGGNLFAPSPYGDLATALLALDARINLQGGYSPREITLDELFQGRDRGPGGIVSGITLNRPAAPDALRFAKMARVRPKGIAVITIAAHLPLSGGRIAGARIAYGAMAPTPIRVPAVERALEGRTLDAAGIADALRVAAEGTSPASDAIASAWYRREMAPVQLRRLLLGR